MRLNPNSLRTVLAAMGGLGVCALLVWGGARWRELPAFPGIDSYLRLEGVNAAPLRPFLELLKLAAAFLTGLVITTTHKHFHRDGLLTRTMEQASILLCVAGALVMIIIGDSMARAFGVFGAASLVRFRTPVDDPKDTTILFILLGIGMACGLGAFGVAVLATLLLCVVLFVLDHLGERTHRAMMVELKANGTEFPRPHVEHIFAAYQAVYEAREVTQGKDASIRYYVVLEPNTPLDAMSEQFLASGYSGIKSVNWETAKKRD